MSIFKSILGMAQKSESPGGGNHQGFHSEAISDGANMKNSTLDGSNKQVRSQDVAWLKLRLDRGEREMFAEFATLTPSLALALLSLNEGNRPIREYRVDSYARDMAAGRWQTNGETIGVSKCGRLIDGQHRLNAVVKSGASINTLFSFGCDYESRLTTDTGAPKMVGDFLGMEGIPNGNKIAAISVAVIEFEAHGKLITTHYQRPTKAEIRDRAESDPAITESFRATRHKNASKIAGDQVLGLCYYLFSRISKDDADVFFKKLFSGAEMKERDPIHIAREKLLDPYKRLRKNEQLKCLFMAWNHHRKASTVRMLTHTIKKGEKLPELK